MSETQISPPTAQMPDSPLYKEFLGGLEDGRIVVRQCAECSTIQWPPKEICGTCQATNWRDHETPDRGTVYTYTVMERAFHPWYADKLPYGAVVVEVEPGVRIVGEYLDGDPEALNCGLEVEAVFGADGVPSRIGWRPVG